MQPPVGRGLIPRRLRFTAEEARSTGEPAMEPPARGPLSAGSVGL
jgi:hypothetical protein